MPVRACRLIYNQSMCGRYVSKEQASIERHWNLIRGGGDPFGPVYNAAPTLQLPSFAFIGTVALSWLTYAGASSVLG